jgi:hypothetical protein
MRISTLPHSTLPPPSPPLNTASSSSSSLHRRKYTKRITIEQANAVQPIVVPQLRIDFNKSSLLIERSASISYTLDPPPLRADRFSNEVTSSKKDDVDVMVQEGNVKMRSDLVHFPIKHVFLSTTTTTTTTTSHDTLLSKSFLKYLRKIPKEINRVFVLSRLDKNLHVKHTLFLN